MYNRRCLSVCLFDCQQLCTTTSERTCMKFSGKIGNGPMNKWLHFGGDPDHRLDIYRDCFPDSSLLGDTESGINRLRCATLQCSACYSRRRHSNYDLIASLALGGGMHCPSASSFQ